MLLVNKLLMRSRVQLLQASGLSAPANLLEIGLTFSYLFSKLPNNTELLN